MSGSSRVNETITSGSSPMTSGEAAGDSGSLAVLVYRVFP